MAKLKALNEKGFYYSQNILIRKEHFGVLMLLGNGKRYVVSNKFFPLLKKIYTGAKETKSKNDLLFIEELLAKGILQRNKPIKNNARLIENKFISKDCLSFPRTVYWECTRKCNYHCVHCYSLSGQGSAQRETSFVKFRGLIKELSEKGVEFLSIGGGEPLLYDHIFDAIKYATACGIMVEMTTNASLMDRLAIGKLKKAGLKFIQVSIDGATKNSYDEIRPGGNYRHVMDILPILASDFILSVCTVANKKNISEIDDIVKISKKAGAKHFRVLPLMAAGRGSQIKHLQLSKKELAGLHLLVRNIKSKEKQINIQFNENLIDPITKNIEWMPKNHYGCSAGRTTCSIDPEGNVYPCSFLEMTKLSCGNINNDTLFDIWKNSRVLDKLRKLDHIQGKCASCKHINLCRGGCRAAAYLKNAKINDSDPLCVIG